MENVASGRDSGNRQVFFLGRSYRLIGLLIVGWGTIAWLSTDYYYGSLAENLYRQESQLARQQAEQVARNIDESIELLKGISLVFSRDEDTHRVLRSFATDVALSALAYEERKQRWTQDKALGELNNSLNIAATNLRADVIWIVNAAGDCISSSNADKSESFVGTNYTDREYYRQARAGQRGRQYAVGRASKIPGLFYSSPIFEKGRFLGAVVVKRNITKFSHLTSQANAFISDANGVIVLAPDKHFEFHSLPNAAVANLSTEKKLLQYKQSTIDSLKMTPWRRRFPSAVLIGEGDLPVMLVAKSLPDDAITIHVPRPLGELVRLDTEKFWVFLLLAAAGSMLIVAVSSVLLYLRESRKTAADLRVAATAFESQEGMAIADAGKVILRVNRAFTAITGYTPEDAVGHKMNLLTSGRHDAAFFAAMWECVHLAGAWGGEIWIRSKDGEEHPCWFTIAAVKGNTGDVTHYVGTLTDITERKQTEEALRQSEMKFSMLFNSTSDAVMLLDEKGFFDCNQATLTLFGCATKEDFCARHPGDLSPPEQPCGANSMMLANQRIATAMEKGSLRFDWVHKRTDIGKRFHAEVLLNAMTLDGRLVLQAVVRDITERKQAEEQLRQLNQTLEQRVSEETRKNIEQERILTHQARHAAMGEMIGNIAHQWRQPLNALGLVVQNIIIDYQEGLLDDKSLAEYKEKALGTVQKMSQTIDDFRDFFKPNRLEETFSLTNPIHETLKLIDASLKNNAIAVTVDCPDNLTVSGLPNEFAQVMLNLLANAKDALLEKNLPVKKIEVVASEEGEYAVVCIRDNGGGIPAEIMDKIFDPYFTSKESGTGIGLYMTRVIVEQHMHGKITCHNTEAGAEFMLSLPREKTRA